MKTNQVIYKRGRYTVSPIVVGYVVTLDGRVVYPALPLEAAIETADEMAMEEEDGIAA